ncbi:MAG: hypothetical protein KatS3mg038_1303 [Candidatus Kapaibacterium sp.]|nr:MAG: hypothetical protein KatS3mg038_1303 [Candidatus Kapabacteria bacterium]
MAADGDRFDDIFVDLDFSRVTEYGTGDLGYGDAVFADYEDSLGVIPEAEWQEHVEELERRNIGCEHLIVHIYNQGRVGSCTSHATCQAMMIAAAVQFGRQRTPILSPISLYKRVARGPNSGSTIEDNVDEAMGRGVLPADVSEQSARFKHVMPSGDWHARFPQGWEETARQFLLDEVYVCRSVAAVVSALLRGHPVIVGRDGHAICYVRPTYRRGALSVIYANSWGQWGVGVGPWEYGFGLDSARQLERASTWAVAVRTVNFAHDAIDVTQSQMRGDHA